MEMEPMDTTPSSRPGITRVPPEICGLIIASTSWKMDDLLSLGRVTSTFAEEADRIIYANVAIRRVGNIVRFCNTLNKRKYLASYVKLLRLFMPPQTQFDPNDVTLLARTLSQLKNLRVLRVAPDEPGAYKDAILRRLATPSKGEAVNGWILEGHPFELEGFENTYFGADTLVHFVNQQPKLKTLYVDGLDKACLALSPLPELKSLSCSVPTLLEFCATAGRRLEFVNVTSMDPTPEEDVMVFSALKTLEGTLGGLSLLRHNVTRSAEVWQLIYHAGHLLPNLKMLQIADNTEKAEESVDSFQIPNAPFKRLETLILFLPTRRVDEQTVSYYGGMNMASGRRAVGFGAFHAIPSLKQVVLNLPSETCYTSRRVDKPYLLREWVVPTEFVKRTRMCDSCR